MPELRLTDEAIMYTKQKVASLKTMCERDFQNYVRLAVACVADYGKNGKISKWTMSEVNRIESLCLKNSLIAAINHLTNFKPKTSDDNIRVKDNLRTFIEFFQSDVWKPIDKKFKNEGKVLNWGRIAFYLVDPTYNFADSLLMEDLLNLSSDLTNSQDLSK